MAINMNSELQDFIFRANRGDVHHRPSNLGDQIVRRSHRVFKGTYDFSVQGGKIGSIALYDQVLGKAQPLNLPKNFIISKVLIDVITAPVGTGATIALTSGQNAADIMAATAITSLTTGLYDGLPTTAASTNIRIPATQASPGSAAAMVIGTAALTAGKFNVFFTGYLSD